LSPLCCTQRAAASKWPCANQERTPKDITQPGALGVWGWACANRSASSKAAWAQGILLDEPRGSILIPALQRVAEGFRYKAMPLMPFGGAAVQVGEPVRLKAISHWRAAAPYTKMDKKYRDMAV